jgi:preprotein translocase subunit YajC
MAAFDSQTAVSSVFDSIHRCLLLADAAKPAADPNAGGGGGGLISVLPGLLIIVALFYFLMLRPERRKAAAHQALLSSLKKNDRVVTVGGIYGVVMNVQRESDEVTLKVDEATNAKIRVTFGAIARVIPSEGTSEPAA